MYSSISYLEISCRYNKLDLKQFVGVLQNRSAFHVIKYRNRKYTIVYVDTEDEFRLFNSKGILVAVIVGELFKFYVSSAPEIGIDLVFGLLAVLNIYPVKK